MQKSKIWGNCLGFCATIQAFKLSEVVVPHLSCRNQVLFYFCEFSVSPTKASNRPVKGSAAPAAQQLLPHCLNLLRSHRAPQRAPHTPLASWTHKLANSLVLTSFWPWAALCTLEPASNIVPFCMWNQGFHELIPAYWLIHCITFVVFNLFLSK